tara:strand:- start:1213 stop:1791 length:579 start_codon:yes stop_codon:yes gene_type:complete
MPAIAFTALCAVMFAGVNALAQNPIQQSAPNEPVSAQVDYDGFEKLTQDVSSYRVTRLVPLDDFLDLAKAESAIILDTRSAADFAAGHIEGAVNLPFSEFTDEKLASVLGDKGRRILIYCNNNFEDNIAPVMIKRAPLALNIPTFINLVGYGYENVYELGESISLDDDRLTWIAVKPNELKTDINQVEGQTR